MVRLLEMADQLGADMVDMMDATSTQASVVDYVHRVEQTRVSLDHALARASQQQAKTRVLHDVALEDVYVDPTIELSPQSRPAQLPQSTSRYCCKQLE